MFLCDKGRARSRGGSFGFDVVLVSLSRGEERCYVLEIVGGKVVNYRDEEYRELELG